MTRIGGPKFLSAVCPVVAQLPAAVRHPSLMLLTSRAMDGLFAITSGDVFLLDVLGRVTHLADQLPVCEFGKAVQGVHLFVDLLPGLYFQEVVCYAYAVPACAQHNALPAPVSSQVEAWSAH